MDGALERLLRMKIQLEALARCGTVKITDSPGVRFEVELENGCRSGALELEEAIDGAFRTLK